MQTNRWSLARVASQALVGLTFAAIAMVAPLGAQDEREYKQIEPPAALRILPSDKGELLFKKKEEQRKYAENARDVLQGRASLSALDKKQRFDNWFLRYLFAMMTLNEADILSELPVDRKKLIRDYLEIATDAGAHQYLVELTLNKMKEIANDEYHPAVRYNAMLIIGELNEDELQRTGLGRPPVPYLPALAVLLQEYKNPDQLDYVRVATLVGMLRHVQLHAYDQREAFKNPTQRIPAATITDIRQTMLDLVDTKVPPEGRSVEGHHWMRRRAVEVLGWLAFGSADAEIVNKLHEVVAKSEDERGVRCQAVLAFGKVKFDPAMKADGAKLASDIAKFIVETAGNEADRLVREEAATEKEFQVLSGSGSQLGGSGLGGGGLGGGPGGRRIGGRGAGGPGMGPGMGGIPGMGGGRQKIDDPYAYRIEPVRRKLKHEIGCAMTALVGIDERKTTIDPDKAGGVIAVAKSADDKAYIYKKKTGRDRSDKDEDLTSALVTLSKAVDEETTADFKDKVETAVLNLNNVINSHVKAPPARAPAGKAKAAPAAAVPAAKDAKAPAEPELPE